jgi:NAD(P)-dependent dehydrogenase (short-subunit alcohol dehydrogenase family)
MSEPVILITGAASGIGRATALRFAMAGWRVGAFDRDEPALSGLAEEAADAGHPLVTGALDVTAEEQWRDALTAFTAPSQGRLDALVNNAGVVTIGPFSEVPLEKHLQTVRVNVDGIIIGCYTSLPFLVVSPRAHVVNMCSASAVYGHPDLAVYSGTKQAVRGLTEAFELEWADRGVRVSSIWPMYVKTPMLDQQQPSSLKKLGARLSAEDVADAVYDTIERPGRAVHRPVGVQARLLYAASQVTPSPATRLVSKLLASR